MADLQPQIDQIRSDARADLAAVNSADTLEAYRIKYLGSKGVLKGVMSLLAGVPKDQKPAAGQQLNALKTAVAEAYATREAGLKSVGDAGDLTEDITEPGRPPGIGNTHILLRVVDELTDLFARLGFAVAQGPELEDEFHNFVALNIPESHPARDPLDNFYIDPQSVTGRPATRPEEQGAEAPGKDAPAKDASGSDASGASDPSDPDPSDAADASGSDPADAADASDAADALATGDASDAAASDRSAAEGAFASVSGDAASALLLRTQTSTVQVRVMHTQPPPIRVVIPGRVYRPDTVDATHLFMFHQLEALVVDRGVTMVDLKSTVLQFIKAYFGQETRVRFRPSFFPFTEPSAEVDVWFEDKQRWIELGGCGMVHPNVLRACHIDPEEYSGWAFGFGIERIAMRKYGINDIRHFIENDVRFLKQF